jgi:hypothetical protein
VRDTDHEHELVGADADGREQWIVDIALDEIEIGFPGRNGAGDLGRIADRQRDGNAELALAKPSEMAGQPVARDSLSRPSGETSSLQALQFAEHPLGTVDLIDDRFRLRQQHSAGRREFHAASDSVEQSHAETAFEGLNGGAGRRLGHVQHGRRLGHVQAFGDRHEYSKLIESHAGIFTGEHDQGKASPK